MIYFITSYKMEEIMIGKFVKSQRSKCKVTLIQIANKVGVTQPYISNIERGVRLPTVEMFFKIVKAIAFLGEENNRKVDFYEKAYDNSKEARYQQIFKDFLDEFSPTSSTVWNYKKEVILNKYKESIIKDSFIPKEKEILLEIITVMFELLDEQTGKFNDYIVEFSDDTAGGNDVNRKLSLKVNQKLDLNFIENDINMKYLDLRIDGKKLDKTDLAILKAAIVGIKTRKDFE